MFDIIKNLKVGDMITVDSKQSYNLTNCEDFEISSLHIFQADDSNAELIIVEFDNDYFLISHTFNEDPQYFIVEINSDISPIDEDECPERVIIKQGRIKMKYALANEWHYLMSEDGEEVAICEYQKGNNILIIEQAGNDQNAYQGIIIEDKHIVV